MDNSFTLNQRAFSASADHNDQLVGLRNTNLRNDSVHNGNITTTNNNGGSLRHPHLLDLANGSLHSHSESSISAESHHFQLQPNLSNQNQEINNYSNVLKFLSLNDDDENNNTNTNSSSMNNFHTDKILSFESANLNDTELNTVFNLIGPFNLILKGLPNNFTLREAKLLFALAENYHSLELIELNNNNTNNNDPKHKMVSITFNSIRLIVKYAILLDRIHESDNTSSENGILPANLVIECVDLSNGKILHLNDIKMIHDKLNFNQLHGPNNNSMKYSQNNQSNTHYHHNTNNNSHNKLRFSFTDPFQKNSLTNNDTKSNDIYDMNNNNTSPSFKNTTLINTNLNSNSSNSSNETHTLKNNNTSTNIKNGIELTPNKFSGSVNTNTDTATTTTNTNRNNDNNNIQLNTGKSFLLMDNIEDDVTQSIWNSNNLAQPQQHYNDFIPQQQNPQNSQQPLLTASTPTYDWSSNNPNNSNNTNNNDLIGFNSTGLNDSNNNNNNINNIRNSDENYLKNNISFNQSNTSLSNQPFFIDTQNNMNIMETSNLNSRNNNNTSFRSNSHTNSNTPLQISNKLINNINNLANGNVINNNNPNNSIIHQLHNKLPNTGITQADLSLLSKIPPPANPADQNPPCNTLYVGNLPPDATEQELRQLFSMQNGFRRLSFKNKNVTTNSGHSHHGPMCFVEFDDVSFATRALVELYGSQLPRSNISNKGGIRLSFSKNPLGVRGSYNKRNNNSNNNNNPQINKPKY